MLDRVSIRVAGWSWKNIYSASLQQSPADGTYSGYFKRSAAGEAQAIQFQVKHSTTS